MLNGLVDQFWIPSIVFVASALLLFVVRGIIFNVLDKFFAKTETLTDDLVLASFRLPSMFLIFAISIYITVASSNIPDKINNIILKTINVAIIIAVSLVIANILGVALTGSLGRAGARLKTTGLFRGVIRGIIYLVGFLVILGNLGISITPLLTTLGVGGLAVALALQDSLSNLFAGMHLLAEQSVKVDDYIMLDSGERGQVVDIGWRTVKIRILGNNLLIIPNGRFAESVVTNYSMYDSKMTLKIAIGVDYASDIDHVERVILDEVYTSARLGDIQGLLVEPPPVLRFADFGVSSLDFILICNIKDFDSQFEVQDQLRRKIFKRFLAEDINIPFPVRTVHIKK